MYETEAELAGLQALLDESLAGASEHLRAIIRPGERTLTAAQLVKVITGMSTLAVSSVTARCEPRVSGADGHFLKPIDIPAVTEYLNGLGFKARTVRSPAVEEVERMSNDDELPVSVLAALIRSFANSINRQATKKSEDAR